MSTKIEYVHHDIIEEKLLAAIGGDQVAILATEADCEIFYAALCHYAGTGPDPILRASAKRFSIDILDLKRGAFR